MMMNTKYKQEKYQIQNDNEHLENMQGGWGSWEWSWLTTVVASIRQWDLVAITMNETETEIIMIRMIMLLTITLLRWRVEREWVDSWVREERLPVKSTSIWESRSLSWWWCWWCCRWWHSPYIAMEDKTTAKSANAKFSRYHYPHVEDNDIVVSNDSHFHLLIILIFHPHF